MDGLSRIGHLDESQRAMVAAKLANMRQGERTDIEPFAKLQKVTQQKAAELLNVSERTVRAAAKVNGGCEDRKPAKGREPA